MACTNDNLFFELNHSFANLLVLEREEQLGHYLDRFRYCLQELEKQPLYQLKDCLQENHLLLIEIFQFRLLATDNIWTMVPSVHRSIREFVEVRTDYEEAFRKEVEDLSLGRLLEFTK